MKALQYVNNTQQLNISVWKVFEQCQIRLRDIKVIFQWYAIMFYLISDNEADFLINGSVLIQRPHYLENNTWVDGGGG